MTAHGMRRYIDDMLKGSVFSNPDFITVGPPPKQVMPQRLCDASLAGIVKFVSILVAQSM